MRALVLFIVFISVIESAKTKKDSNLATYVPPLPKGRVLFLETFQSRKKLKQIWEHTTSPRFPGKFSIEDPEEPVGIEGDKGLVAVEGKKKLAISTKNTMSIDNKDTPLIFQY
jgi:hypothetical protein